MKKTIIFIHGMFQNAKSWDNWVIYFMAHGYNCIAESWPLHEGEPKELREHPDAALGNLRLKQVIDKYADLIALTNRDAILIGHSVGGLIVQSLINKGLGSLGVCISSVAPNRMLTFDWSFFRNSISIANPFMGDEPFMMNQEGFHQNFCNTMTEEASNAAFEQTATHDSRNILRDCMLEDGEIDLEASNKPMLFIAAEKDEIIPPELNEKNAKAYKEGLADFKEFPDRGHFICGQPGWQEIVDHTSRWINSKAIS